MREKAAGLLLWIQGIYYFITGVWPLVHMPSFLAVTGPKNDLWLVRTVAALIVAVACTLLLAAYRRTYILEIFFLAMASAFSLLAVDIIFVTLGIIPPVYLLDAPPELVFILVALYCMKRREEKRM